MKVVKKFLIVLAILIAIPLIVALFVPKKFAAQSEITIDKPKQEVFNYVKFMRNQDHFGVWQLSDPQMKKSEVGTDGQVGFKYSWDGEKVGKGSQTITRIVEGETIETSLDFGFGEPSKGYFILKEISLDQTAVTWGITGKSPYPWNLMNLFMNMNKDFDQGLKNLKNILK
ncbi:SRPBCC family protein [Sphingobacterium prati]|uniref:SRPBCC family protein n=1 Tax=Sphingobacterium prati TaxID=2737006 RepID=UPI001552BAC9|nr:SRPBCC family protein [Sphingobacterium prati]NPE46993.1 SRPBCC family protein [Sphingobacterium prati]